MGSDSVSMISNAMALAWKEYGQPKYVYNVIMYVLRMYIWENLKWEKLTNLANCKLFINILLANYVILEI